MKIKQGFVVRKVGDSHVVVPVGELSKNFHGMITLNETAKFLWDYFQEEHTPDEALAMFLETYEVEEDVAKADIKAFIETLARNNFLEM